MQLPQTSQIQLLKTEEAYEHCFLISKRCHLAQVIDVQSDRCSLSYTGPAQIRAGVEAAIKDKFPTIKEIGFEAS